MNNHYNKNLKIYARELRTETVSQAEKYLWKAILSRNQTGVKFKRQRPIGFYIVDFFSAEIGLIIEIDGNSHVNKGEQDKKRQSFLENKGYEFVRYSEGEVLNNIENVDDAIRNVINCLKSTNVCTKDDFL